jgi:hypothetical protein
MTTTAYSTIAALREYLPQTAQTSAAESLLRSCLARARSIVDSELRLRFWAVDVDSGAAEQTYPTASARQVRCAPAQLYLRLPPYAEGSVTAVSETRSGTALLTTEWAEDWGAGLFTLRFTGDLSGLWDPVSSEVYDTAYPRREGWRRDAYTVTAQWGNGPAPASIVEMNLELAVNIWRSREKGGFAELSGPGGTAIRSVAGLSSEQRRVIARVRRDYQMVGGP